MRKLLVAFLMPIFLLACSTEESYIDKHNKTTHSFDTYIITINNSKLIAGEQQSVKTYFYVDQVHEMISMRSSKEEQYELSTSDVLFSHNKDSIYSYLYTDKWVKYKVNDKVFNIYNYEEIIFSLLENSLPKNDNDLLMFENKVKASNIDTLIFQMLGISIDNLLLNSMIDISAVYDTNADMFTEFSFDLSATMNYSADSHFIQDTDSSSWVVTATLGDYNSAFDLSMSDYTEDDYLNNFDYFDLLGLQEKYSYDKFSGVVTRDDQDIIKFRFTEDNLYKLYITDITAGVALHIKILNSNFNVIKEFVLSSFTTMSKYYQYPKGEYYVVVTNNGDITKDIDYSFLFISSL